MIFAVLSVFQPQTPGGQWETLQSVHGSQQAEKLGFSLDWIGDVDGDAVDDMIVGSEGPITMSGFAGSVSIYSGRTGVRLRHLLPDMLVNPGIIGGRVSRLGDVTQDGTPEFLVYIRGPGSAISRVAVFTFQPFDILFEVTSPLPPTDFGGFGIAGGTDLDGDGIPDFAVTDSTYDLPFTNAGAIHAFSGLNGALLWTVTGTSTTPSMGQSVSMPGDLNGDGYADVLGNSLKNGNTLHVLSGRDGSQLYELDGGPPTWDLGGPSICGDMDGDGLADFLTASPDIAFTAHHGVVTIRRGHDGAVLHRWDVPPRPNEEWGYGFGPGDVDGDGVPDVSIGAREHYAANGARGGVYVYSGRTYEPMALLESPSPPAETFTFGLSYAATMGDVGSDGRKDLLVSDYGWKTGALAAVGAAYVLAFDSFLMAEPRAVSAAAGGAVQFRLDFPASEAGRKYLLLASEDLPGSASWRGVSIPLVRTPLLKTMAQSPPPVFDQPQGTLDANGAATVIATLPPGALAAFAGRTVKFAAVSMLSPGQPSLSSAAAWVTVNP